MVADVPLTQTSLVGWSAQAALSVKTKDIGDFVVHPRIITVGCWKRGKVLASLLDNVQKMDARCGLEGCTGTYKGVGVSIIPSGMGAPLMEQMMRGIGKCVTSPIAIIRLGTCGIFNPNFEPGTIMVGGKGSMYIYVNYAKDGCLNYDVGTEEPQFLLCNPEPADEELSSKLVAELAKEGVPHFNGLNACGETFYSCQGRKNEFFEDDNTHIVPDLAKAGVDFVEMESHMLLHMARLRKIKCHASACAIGIVNRVNEEMTANVGAEQIHELEIKGGRACLEALLAMDL